MRPMFHFDSFAFMMLFGLVLLIVIAGDIIDHLR